MQTVHRAIGIERLQPTLAWGMTPLHARTNIAFFTAALDRLAPTRPICAALYLISGSPLSEMTTSRTIMGQTQQFTTQRRGDNGLQPFPTPVYMYEIPVQNAVANDQRIPWAW